MSDASAVSVLFASMAVMVASVAGCIVGEKYVAAERDKTQTAEQMCVKAAWTQADRIECLKAKQ